MIGFAPALSVAIAAAIVAGLLLWAARHGTLREDDQEHIDRSFWAIVGQLESETGPLG